MKTWLITGAAAGLGREWTEAALERGDRVAATGRSGLERLDDLRDQHAERLLALELDVTDRERAFAVVQEAADTFGSLDVVVNNAGYGHFGMVEELTEAEVRAQMETNFYGTLWVTQAALPIMRAQGAGHILQNTSEGGIIAYPGIGAYHASKWAVEGLTESLAQEVAGLGIKVTLVEPGPFGTGWLDAGVQSARIPAYDPVRPENLVWELGDPRATREAILKVVDAQEPPRRIFLGRGSLPQAEAAYAERLETWREWQPVSVAAMGAA
ncbi:SDR family NAD(P)-dependent oxidoreductase [Solirubrobacter sp. CPCC 204708]|uniref:SDR family NAD(P)-dependent oxidoreductase n=1 Tax=Solirubrobacter deserti TaxID=2282478 RepID=A0ABT4RTZ6_9ACTN|nr:SDR family NAD(P)-dependent oxidoreductase [Solirubrobacter deserti]MBE2317276.1 SDR family NAD(P)-dependent oxidoreductase [Solirubrobacter deserti]MDA0142043.1 SDR family NAD(P)-dependent oxidoreductase [Solirubrobacter deserti]